MNYYFQTSKICYFLLFVFVWIFNSCQKSGDTTKVLEQEITESVYASGIIKAVEQYEVFAASTGIIKEILVEEGDAVSKGSPLFIIDNEVSTFSAENARIAMELSKDQSDPSSNTLRDLEGRLKLAHEKMINDSVLYVRQMTLWEQNVGSKLDLERRELAFKASSTEYNSILLQNQQLKSELEKNTNSHGIHFRFQKNRNPISLSKAILTG